MLSNMKRSIILLVIFSSLFFMCESKTSTESNPEWNEVFYDNFNRSDGLIGNNYSAMLYIPSVAMTDTLFISNNQLKLTGE